MGAKGAANYDARRVASEVATSVVACRFTATERSAVDARAQLEGLSAGLLGRKLLLEASKAKDTRVGLAPDPTVAGAARWLVQLVQQLELPGPVKRAAADLHVLLGAEGEPARRLAELLVDDLVVAGDVEQLEQLGDQVGDALAVVRRRAKKPAEEAPKSGPRLADVEAVDDAVERLTSYLEEWGDTPDEGLLLELCGDDKDDRKRMQATIASLVASRGLVRVGSSLHLVSEAEAEAADSDPVAEMVATAAAEGKAPPLRIDPLADVVWPPKSFGREAAPFDGDPPSPGQMLRVIAKKPATTAALTARWPRVRVAWLMIALDVLCARKLVAHQHQSSPLTYHATDRGREAASLSSQERTIDLPLPSIAPPRAALMWRRTWVGKGKAHTVDGIDRGRTVCGERIQAPKWRSAPEEAEDCAKCARMRTSATARGAAQEARP